eukprot:CAMPEP_0170478692 /NCGR_PEP_ID=MMETSP0208-20121228/183_1 /TAXON_ID=197538 /ORGANISM="Strombidium inclinatum, Strain S3" /LENGTH=223 /DNA_ID=CAMNT_0010750989 /DNA_START=23 /DNA_END=694 /DNA_ORIENTATION=+
MNKLFGASKKKEPEAINPNAPSLTETSEKLGERGDVVQKKVDALNQELMQVKKEMVNAKGMRKKTLQQKALHILKRRKMYDNQLGHLQNQQFNVDQVAFANESIQDTLNTVSAMKEAAKVQKAQMDKFDMDQVEDMMDDMADLMADQEDIQEMMGRNFGVDYDEADLMDELNELDEEIIGEQLNEGLGLPSYIPQNQNVNKDAAKPDAAQPSESEALENMMQI